MQKTASVSIFLTIGTLIIGLAIFAKQLGLDPSPGWGKSRMALLLLGLLIASIPWTVGKRYFLLDKGTTTDLFVFPALLIVIAIYLWFISVSHDATSNYYSLLATSFRNGELSLPLKPDPALLGLPNPYDPAARQGIKVPVDLSLYKGKFYLYWGPAPSLLLAIVQPFWPAKIGEVHLLFLFLCGILLSEFVFIMHIWQRYVPQIPKWMVILSIFVAGLANPALWLLSQPKIYEAAIGGAQFFFIAGLVSAILSLDRQPVSKWGLALTGILWALAVGTRSVAVFPVIFMTFMVAYLLFKLYRQSFLGFVSELIPLALPLLIGAFAFCWYNWARFGSLLETGFTYQLAAPYLQKHMSDLFSVGYVIQNSYNYLLNPFRLKQAFPFLYPIRGRIQDILPWQFLPNFYTAQAITGLLYAVPFLFFAIIPMILFVRQLFKSNPRDDSVRRGKTVSLNWIVLSLIGSFLLPFVSLLAFFWTAMRYAEDFMPELTLLSIVGFWQGYQWLSQNSKKHIIYAALGGVLAGISLIGAVLLALSNYYANGLL